MAESTHRLKEPSPVLPIFRRVKGRKVPLVKLCYHTFCVHLSLIMFNAVKE